MTLAMTWPVAAVVMTAIAGGALVLATAIWGVFRTGQTAIQNEDRR
jgi:hypothetical protein